MKDRKYTIGQWIEMLAELSDVDWNIMRNFVEIVRRLAPKGEPKDES